MTQRCSPTTLKRPQTADFCHTETNHEWYGRSIVMQYMAWVETPLVRPNERLDL